MAIGMNTNVAGTWKKITGAHTNVAGTWKEITAGYQNVSGVWKKFYPASYEIDYSGSFSNASNKYLTRLNSGTANNADKLTVSVWVKRASTGSRNIIGGGKKDNDNKAYCEFDSSNRLGFHFKRNEKWQCDMVTNATYTSTTGWYHIHMLYDSNQATASNRFTLHVNGSLINSAVSGNWVTYDLPGSSEAARWCENGERTEWGAYTDNRSDTFDGLLANAYVLEGTLIAYTNFGETSGSSWVPIEYNTEPAGGLSSFLEFANSSSLGADSWGNGTFTNYNSVTRSTTTPTS